MASVLYMQPMAPIPSSNAQALQPQRPTLRRATYVHVSDLTSAYNIDHSRLEQELSRVKNEGSSGLAVRNVSGLSPETVTTEVAVAVATSEEDELVSGVEPLTDLETSLGGAATPQRRLQPPRGGFNLCVLVGTVNVVVDKRRVDQSRVRLAEVGIGDETGTVSLRARDEQIDILEEVSRRSGAVVLRNCTLELYQGKHIRLAVTKWGKLATYPDNVASTPPPPSKMNLDRNFSLIDLSIVASEMTERSPTPEIEYPSRQTRQAEAEGGSGGPAISSTSSGPSIGSPSGRASASKAGQTHTKHQQQQTSRRTSRSNEQRRHSRGNKGPTGGRMAVHFGGIKQDSGQQLQQGQIIYHGMPGYPGGYEQTIDMRQYPLHSAYTQHTRHQDDSGQRMLLLQQYDLQQRQQFHQMYGHGHQEHHHRTQGHQSMQPSQMMLRPMGSSAAPSASYETGEQHQHQHQHIPLVQGVGANAVLVPMGISMPHGMMPHSHPDQYPSPKLDGLSTSQDSRSSGEMSHFPIGKMNPDATSFAPYGSPQGIQGATQGQGTLQFTYDLSQSLSGATYQSQTGGHHAGSGATYQTQTGHHAGVYGPEIMYSVAPNPTLNSPPENEVGVPDASGKAYRQKPPSTGISDPEASGKENFTAKP